VQLRYSVLVFADRYLPTRLMDHLKRRGGGWHI
jgi:hypothetical protein